MKQKFRPIKSQLYVKLGNQLLYKLLYQLRGQLRDQLVDQLVDQLWGQIKEVIENETEV